MTDAAAEIAVCPACGMEVPPEWGLFDYFDHLAGCHPDDSAGGTDEMATQ